MPAKGKKPEIYEVPDSDSDIDFFTHKAKLPKRISPIRNIDLRQPSPSFSDEEDEELELSPAKKKKRRRKPVRQPKSSLPTWTKPISASDGRRKISRGRSDTRDKSETINLVSSEEGESGKGKRVETKKKRRLSLTPPPKLSDAKLAAIHAKVDEHFAASVQVQAPEAHDPSDTVPGNGESLLIEVRMVADPETMPEGASENAKRQYEKSRKVKVYKDAHLEVLWETIASRVNKMPDEIVLVYEGQKIISNRITPRQLRMEDCADVRGYEKSYWERLETQRIRNRQRLINGNTPSPSPPRSPSPSHLPTSQTEVRKRIALRGEWGEAKLGVSDFVTAQTLAEHYCRKFKNDASLAKRVRLMIDGEKMDPSRKAGDMDIEDGDCVDLWISA